MTKPYVFRLRQADLDRYEEMAEIEKNFHAEGYALVAGADEAGRGPLAGPVFAAACILDPERPIPGLNDSKKISAQRREALFDQIQEKALAYAVTSRPSTCIDRINILEATKEATREALEALSPPPSICLLDALRIKDLRFPQRALIKGDAHVNAIAAASILAKVSRDRYMFELDKVYPGYGFASHKGYGTAAHYEALRRLGPCPEHRLSFLGKLKLGQSEKEENTSTMSQNNLVSAFQEAQLQRGLDTEDQAKAEPAAAKVEKRSYAESTGAGRECASRIGSSGCLDRGHRAEGRVAEHLASQGYCILERNFRLPPFGEIDLIAEKNKVLFIIEVKARHESLSKGRCLEAIDHRKVSKLRLVAAYYQQSRHLENHNLRFLAAACELGEQDEVLHICYREFFP